MDAGYAVIIRAMFAQLERTAGPDVKHGDRLRLENYTLLETELQPLAKKVLSPYLESNCWILHIGGPMVLLSRDLPQQTFWAYGQMHLSTLTHSAIALCRYQSLASSCKQPPLPRRLPWASMCNSSWSTASYGSWWSSPRWVAASMLCRDCRPNANPSCFRGAQVHAKEHVVCRRS